MNLERRPLRPNAFVVVIAVGIVAAWSIGCNKSGSTDVDAIKAREAFNKRWADYGSKPAKPIAGKK
jgi:hypothetical protein